MGAVGGGSGSDQSVLVVEDDLFIANLISTVAKKSGLVPLEADSAAQVRALVPETVPDLIVMDINLEGSSGVEVLEYLSECRVASPIVIISGNGLERLAELSKLGQDLQLPVHSIREKPINTRLLKEVFGDLRAGRLRIAV